MFKYWVVTSENPGRKDFLITIFFLCTSMLGQHPSSQVFKPYASAPQHLRGILIWNFGGPQLKFSNLLPFWPKWSSSSWTSRFEQNQGKFCCIRNFSSPLLWGGKHANPRETQKLPSLIILVFFPPRVRNIFVSVESSTCRSITSLSVVPGTDACVVI